MRLVYKPEQNAVQIGDVATIDGQPHTVIHFRPPTSPASEGMVTVRPLRGGHSRELYVSLVGAEWIEREDRQPLRAMGQPVRIGIQNHYGFIAGRRYRTRDGSMEAVLQSISTDDGTTMDFVDDIGTRYPRWSNGQVYNRTMASQTSDRDFLPTPVDAEPAAPTTPGCPFIVGRRYRTRDGLVEGTFRGLDPSDSEIVKFEDVTGPSGHEMTGYARARGYYPTYLDGRVYLPTGRTDPRDFLPTPVDAEPELRQSPAEPTWSMDPPPAPGVYQVRINPTGRDFFSRWNGSYWGLTCGTAAQARTEYQDTRGDDCNSDRFRGWAPLTNNG